MRRPLAFAIVVGVAYAARTLGDGGSPLRGTGLALGFALIAAALAGTFFERVGLPRLSGYLVFGLACGPYLGDIISRSMARQLQLANGLAIALIAFVAGLELNLARLRPRLRAIAGLSFVTLGFLYAGLLVTCWALWPWLPIAPEATGAARVALAALLATVAASFSPTVTIAVIAESRARGPLSELVLAVVVLADLVLIFLFTLVMQAVRWVLGEAPAGDVSLLARLTWEILGSLAFGAALGAVFAVYLRYVGREITVVLLGLCAVLSAAGGWLHFEPLLAALAAGLVVENVAPPRGDALKEAVERGGLPVLVVFFVAAGTSLQIDALGVTGGAVCLLLALARAALLREGTRLGARRAGLDPALGALAWMGLVSQAGVTLGLTVLVAVEFPEWGEPLQALVVVLSALHVLAGPILFRMALSRAGEVGQMDAGERPSAAPA
jgi:Kef-type K+ transport system membrane component KefB